MAIGIARFAQKTVIGKLHVVGHQLTAIEGRFVVPFDTVAQMEDIGRLVWLLPAFSQMGLDCEGARPHVRTNFIPHQRAVGEAQRSIGLEIEGEMRVKVGRIIAAHAQDTAALGLSRFSAPERWGTRERPARERDTSDKASLEQITTAHTLAPVGMSLLRFHCS